MIDIEYSAVNRKPPLMRPTQSAPIIDAVDEMIDTALTCHAKEIRILPIEFEQKSADIEYHTGDGRWIKLMTYQEGATEKLLRGRLFVLGCLPTDSRSITSVGKVVDFTPRRIMTRISLRVLSVVGNKGYRTFHILFHNKDQP